MITAEFIKNDIRDWNNAKNVVINKKTVIGSPDIHVGIRCEKNLCYLLELHTFDELICFSSLKVIGKNVIFGFGEHVHFFNTEKETLISIKLDTYFSGLYIASDLDYIGNDFGVLVASAEYLHRFTPLGEEVWKSLPLGIDGVIVTTINSLIIQASGEWDPPGGWIDVKIDLDSGASVNKE